MVEILDQVQISHSFLLDENEGKILHAHESWETALINALDWLLAEGTITVDGSERRVSELVKNAQRSKTVKVWSPSA